MEIFKRSGQPSRQITGAFNLSKSNLHEGDFSSVPLPSQLYKPLPSLKLDEMYQSMIDHFMSPCLVLNEYNEVIFCSKEATQLINVPVGKINYTIFKMVPVHVSLAIGAAIKRVKEQVMSVCCQHIEFVINNVQRRFNITISALPTNHSLYLLMFDEQTDSAIIDKGEPMFLIKQAISELVVDLEQELHYTQQHLQTTIEELETANGAKVHNEELIASNEELQSTNEELQSVNEELIVLTTSTSERLKN
ncbi:hypothetical protein [Priestia megaterium]|uniref:hypothetical protein n=1 Tax=Priestia megaterium TaxID=1404 RepID=UPI002378F7FD|nr:hypothetical protein [Priestia megaterium]